MSSFKKDKKHVSDNITINSIENSKESELNITSNPNPESVKVDKISSNIKVETLKTDDDVVVLDISKDENITDSTNDLKSEDLLNIVLNANINNIENIDKKDIDNRDNESIKNKNLLTYNKKITKKINTFTKNESNKNVKVNKNTDNKKHINKIKPEDAKIPVNLSETNLRDKSNSGIKTSIKPIQKIKKDDQIRKKSFKININDSKIYIKKAAQSLKDYQLPKVVTNAMFLIVLMFVACISLIISINNRNNKHTGAGIVNKTYISPIYEGSTIKSLGAFSQSTISPVVSPASEITNSQSDSSIQILNEIAQLQNAVSIDTTANTTIDKADVGDMTISEEGKSDDIDKQNIERLNYLLKSYVIISPSVDASVNQIFYEYFDARMNVDIEKYLSLFGYDTAKINIDSFSGIKKTLEYERSLVGMITNIKIYICNGFNENEKICFVNYDMLLRYANALVPSVFYANLVLEGDKYIIKPELDKYRQIYIDHIIKHDEIKSLNYNVQNRLAKVLENNDFARLVYVSLRDKQIKIEEQLHKTNDEFGAYIINQPGGVFSSFEPVSKVVLDDLRAQMPYDSIPSYHGLLTDPLLK